MCRYITPIKSFLGSRVSFPGFVFAFLAAAFCEPLLNALGQPPEAPEVGGNPK